MMQRLRACAQAFMCDQLRMLDTTGIQMPAAGGLPDCIWHNPNRCATPCVLLASRWRLVTQILLAAAALPL